MSAGVTAAPAAADEASLLDLIKEAEDRLTRCARDEFDMNLVYRLRKVLTDHGVKFPHFRTRA